MWYVYLLRLANEDIYVGSTNDLRRRFSARIKLDKCVRRESSSLRRSCHMSPLAHARALEDYFKSGSGKAVALKRLVREPTKPKPQNTVDSTK